MQTFGGKRKEIFVLVESIIAVQCSAGGLERTLELQEQCWSASEIGVAAAFSPAIFQEVFTNSWVLLKQIV